MKAAAEREAAAKAAANPPSLPSVSIAIDRGKFLLCGLVPARIKANCCCKCFFMKSCLHVCMHVCVCLWWRKVDQSLVGSEAVRPCCLVSVLFLSLSLCSLQSPPPRTPAAAVAAEKSLSVAVSPILLLVVIMYVCSVCDRGYISLAGR